MAKLWSLSVVSFIFAFRPDFGQSVTVNDNGPESGSKVLNPNRALIYGHIRQTNPVASLDDSCLHVTFKTFSAVKGQTVACLSRQTSSTGSSYSLEVPFNVSNHDALVGMLSVEDASGLVVWQRAVSVVGHAQQVDIQLDQQPANMSSLSDDSSSALGKAGAAHVQQQHGTWPTDADTAPAMLWECLHMQCSQAALASILHCPAKHPYLTLPAQPTCPQHVAQQNTAAATESRATSMAAFIADQPLVPILLAVAVAEAVALLAVVLARNSGGSRSDVAKHDTRDHPMHDQLIDRLAPPRSSGGSGGSAVLDEHDTASKNMLPQPSGSRMQSFMPTRSHHAISKQDVSGVDMGTESLMSGERSGRKQSKSSGTQLKQSSSATRRQSYLWQRQGNRLQRTDEDSSCG